MEWEVFESPDCTSFITTDSPVSFFNFHFLPPTEAGIGLLGTRVLFPLNPKYLLVFRHPEFDGSNKAASSQRLPVPEINEGTISVTYLPLCSYEQVVTFNKVMFELSEQIIVANSPQVLIDCLGIPRSY